MKKMKKDKKKALMFSLGVLALIIAFMAISFIDAGASVLDAAGATSPGVIYATMALIGSIDATSDKDSAGAQIVMRVWLIERDQLNNSIPFPKANASREISSIPMKNGEYMHYIECIDGSQADKSSGAKDDITTVVTNIFSLIMGGNKPQMLNFIENKAGSAFIIIYQMADDGDYYILGNNLKPLYLKGFERTNDKANRSISLNFENQSLNQPYKYTGVIIEEPAAKLVADATTLAINTARQYETSGANTVATTVALLSGINGSDIGRTIEVVGGGGANASIVSSTTDIVLKDDENWVANVGSKIVFRILDTSTIVEMSRIQTS